MARPRRRRVRDRRGYNDCDAAYLITGCRAKVVMPFDPMAAFFSRLSDANEAEVSEAWETMKDELLPRFIRDNPGRRPWGWWACESPERRRRDESERDYLERLDLLTPEER